MQSGARTTFDRRSLVWNIILSFTNIGDDAAKVVRQVAPLELWQLAMAPR